MPNRFHRVSVGASVVRVAARVGHFITDDRVEGANLDVDAVAHRSAQRDVSLFQRHVIAAGARHNVVADDRGIRTEPQFDLVASRPVCFIQRLFQRDIDDVQIEAVLLRWGVVGVGRRVGVPRAQRPVC